jgi:hypothetical protein
MKNIERIAILLSLFVATAMSQSGTGTIADLPAKLQEALQRDSACEKSAHIAPPSSAQFLHTPIVTQEIRGVAGREIGVVVAPQGGCHCKGANCATYVYLKSGPAYKLAFSRILSSLHPMKAFNGGLPSLTGKLQVDESRTETTVYDWTGNAYKAKLCATITQLTGQKRPTIARHACGRTP